ncbi:hypothetical protein PPERSA_12211 [Pseudocohnilembus persalinus]|uniref:Transmembrane protein n=1 Tax=Pseudocohnilembus persalinus TaxID=266149 RepID=A0A0V0R8M9_PSEPJ|nr:hypothetical protein PPERSA_12211 [Pseudocohnilembus persalinus]|eukprot:KRX10860.1 hypothetical protein PPERSA_12211 [Pseudocohnilembus persalinus]
MDRKKEKQLMKKLEGVYILQAISLLLVFYGLFYYYNEVYYISSQENPLLHIHNPENSQKDIQENQKNNLKSNNYNSQNKQIQQQQEDDNDLDSQFIDSDQKLEDIWNFQQYKHVYLFFVKADSNKLDENDDYNDINFNCEFEQDDEQTIQCKKTIYLDYEPLCFPEQKISAITTGSYPNILDHLYTHSLEPKDSVIEQLQIHKKKSIIFGKSQPWLELFPFHFSQTNQTSQKQILQLLEHVIGNDISLAIGEYEEKNQLIQDISDLVENLNHSKSTLLLIHEEPPCSIYNNRKSKLIAYSTYGFLDILSEKTKKQLPNPKQIDLASTLSLVMGLPIPYENFGNPIIDLYSQNMKTIFQYKSYDIQNVFHILYNQFLTLKTTVHYLTSLYNQFPFNFDYSKLKQIADTTQKFVSEFQDLQKDLEKFELQENIKEDIYKIKKSEFVQKIEKQIVLSSKLNKQARLMIEHSNYGAFLILLFGLFGFASTFGIFAMIMTTFANIRTFLKNSGIAARLNYVVEGEFLTQIFIGYSIIQVIVSLLSNDIQQNQKINFILSITLSCSSFYLMGQKQIFEILYAKYVGGILMGIIIYYFLLKIHKINNNNKNQQYLSQYISIFYYILTLNVGISEFFYTSNYKEKLQYLVIILAFFGLGLYSYLFRVDGILGSRELSSLEFTKNTHTLLQLIMNLAQISIAPTIVAFILPIWIKVINTGQIKSSTIFDSQDEKYQKLSRFASIFLMGALFTLRLSFYILTIIIKDFQAGTEFSTYRILKEGFIFEAITQLEFLEGLSIICYQSRYFQSGYLKDQQQSGIITQETELTYNQQERQQIIKEYQEDDDEFYKVDEKEDILLNQNQKQMQIDRERLQQIKNQNIDLEQL